MYALIRNSDFIRRLSDGAVIPPDPANRDYREYLDWVAAGNVAEPAPGPSPEQVQQQYAAAIQAHLDAAARARGYDGILSCVSYLGSAVEPWAAEAAAARAWRDAVWVYAYALLASPPNPLPTPEELIAAPEFPVIEWPEL